MRSKVLKTLRRPANSERFLKRDMSIETHEVTDTNPDTSRAPVVVVEKLDL